MAKKMYVHTKIKAKPKKIYLTAMALLLMFGTVASPTSVVGLQVAQAKTSPSIFINILIKNLC